MNNQIFEEGKSWGISAAIDLHSCNPQTIRSEEKIKQFVYELCDIIEVKRFGECTVVHFGEREEIAGFSMTQLIETSLVSGHFVNLTNNVFLDVFSCKYFDPEVVANKAKEFFEAESITLNYLVRK
ncbi:S-adenosylmethionine decarboxylase [Candidatus Saccharibacteria bacterium]|nr:S-adenosylmethionine decarboxylase [Candidatus Saccharibacteria bacterium]